MNSPVEEQRFKRRTTNPPLIPSSNMQGQRRNLSRDRNANSYSPGSFQGNRGGNTWDGARSTQGLNQHQSGGFVEEHVPVRNFNSRDVSDFLNRGYMVALNAAQSPYGDEASKPLIYKSPEKPWTTTTRTGANAWNNRPHVMGNGAQFLAQLKKGVDNLPAANE